MALEVEFQSGPTNPTDLDALIKRAVDTNPQSVELWQDFSGFDKMSDEELNKSAKALEANAK